MDSIPRVHTVSDPAGDLRRSRGLWRTKVDRVGRSGNVPLIETTRVEMDEMQFRKQGIFGKAVRETLTTKAKITAG
jgi:hypothetical protein